MLAGSASAQTPPAVDCDAVKNSLLPAELTYHGQDGTKYVVQVWPDKSGDSVFWSRQTWPANSPTPPVLVMRGVRVDGGVASAEMWTNFTGKYSHRTGKYTPEGFPKNFDRRSDVTYKIHAVLTSLGDGSVDERTSTNSYTFKSEETIVIGSCALRVIHGEIDTVNDAGRKSHTFQQYFPELRISATATDAEPVVDGLSTAFSEIKPPN